MNFDHILITRFNLRYNPTSAPPSKDWMNKRIKLFNNYCLPSVLAQKNKNFQWLIILDQETSNEYKDFFECISKKNTSIYIWWAESWESIMSSGDFQKQVMSLAIKKRSFIITTRLDNDDAIHENFISIIQEKVEEILASKENPIEKFAINLTKGYCLRVEPNYELTSRLHYSNPFITFVEECKDYSTILTVCHLWHDHYIYQTNFPVIQVNTIPYWVQIIHSSNLINDLYGFPCLQTNVLKDFSIDIQDIHFNSYKVYINFFYRGAIRLYQRIISGIVRRFKG